MTLPVICILGPTAAGKTALALTLADRYPVSLISVDSTQIYRGMNIGSAKPSPQTLSQYPHALIDILEPEESYSAARFCIDAQREIQAAHTAGKIPVLVGGTMLYYYALFTGLTDLPAANPDIRLQIEQRIAAEGAQVLYDELAARDPQTAAQISVNDRQRLIRFTELMQLSGKTPGELYGAQTPQIPQWPVIAFGLNPARSVLHQNIALRFKQMVTEGFVDEVRLLKGRRDFNEACPAMKSVGYRQMLKYLAGEYTLAEATEYGVIATRQLAKRQITWMNNRLAKTLPLKIYDPLEKDTLKHILNCIKEFLIFNDFENRSV